MQMYYPSRVRTVLGHHHASPTPHPPSSILLSVLMPLLPAAHDVDLPRHVSVSGFPQRQRSARRRTHIHDLSLDPTRTVASQTVTPTSPPLTYISAPRARGTAGSMIKQPNIQKTDAAIPDARGSCANAGSPSLQTCTRAPSVAVRASAQASPSEARGGARHPCSRTHRSPRREAPGGLRSVRAHARVEGEPSQP